MERGHRFKPITYHVATIGCRTNRFDSAVIEGVLLKMNLSISPIPERADICIVNTCTVTSKSDAESRRLIRRLRRLNPDALIVATGCYAWLFPERLKEIGADLILERDGDDAIKRSLLHIIDKMKGEEGRRMGDEDPAPFFRTTRAYLKIQEGCDSRCTYCIVPYARGPSRSVPLKNIVEEFSILARNHKEIVLCGTRLGDWGKKGVNAEDNGKNLSTLIRTLLSLPYDSRIRLSSIEPMDITEEIIELIKGEERVCKHLHISMQSGSDRILKSMGRGYDSSSFIEIVKKFKKDIPDAGLGIDVIAGFMGEGESEFMETMNLIKELPVTYLHIFPYSERPWTEAPNRGGRVPEKEKKRRVALLSEVSEEKRRRFISSMIGKREKVLIEEKRGNGWVGLTSNYIRVLVESDRLSPSTFAMVEITGFAGREAKVAIGRLTGF